MKRRLALIAFALSSVTALSSCVSSRSVPGPDGVNAQLIQCSYGISHCYEKAADVCDGVYRILDSSSSTYSDAYGVETQQSLLVECY